MHAPKSILSHAVSHGHQSLEAPISFDEIGAVSTHSQQKGLSTEVANGSPDSLVIFSLQAQLNMQDAKHKESTHGVIKDWAIATIELSDRGQAKGEWHVFTEVAVGADVDRKRVASTCCVLAQILVILDTVVAASVREEDQIGGEWKGPCASDCYYMLRYASQWIV